MNKFYIPSSTHIFRLIMYFVSDMCNNGDRGSTVVKVPCYKSEGRWFDPSWCQWIFL